MGRLWDHGVPSAEVWREVLRVLRPGAHLFAFGGTRTFHRLACAIEDAGFEIRDSVGIAWCTAEGMPKGINISKAIDRAAGAERQEVGRKAVGLRSGTGDGFGHRGADDPAAGLPVTAPATPEAARWEGWNSALKPAFEPVVVAMKPLDGTFAQNALRHGVAGFNIDGNRLATPGGRWPPNLALLHSASCERIGTRRVKTATNAGSVSKPGANVYGDFAGDRPAFDYAGPDGLEERSPGTEGVEAWRCAPGCAVDALDRQAGTRTSGGMDAGTPRHNRMGYSGSMPANAAVQDFPADSGPASRFFFRAPWEAADFFPARFESKAAPAEREIGMGPGEKCRHPTLKPLSLTAYLARLLLPPARPDGPRRLLVPFSGAGSEMIGAVRAGWDEVVGVELEPQSVEDAERRLRGDGGLLVDVLREPAE